MLSEKAEKSYKLCKIITENLLLLVPGYIYWKNKEGELLGCSKEHAKYFGFKDSSEVIGKTNFDLMSNEDAIKITEIDNLVIHTGKVQEIEERHNGRWFLSRKMPLKDNDGEILGIFGLSLDITAQKELEFSKSIAADNLLVHIPGHVYWSDKKGIILGCNEEQAKYIGLQSGNEIIGKTLFNLVSKEDAIRATNIDNIVIQTGEAQVAKERHGSKWFLSKKAPLKDFKGETIGVFGLSLEITKQKIAEEALLKQNMELVKALEVKDRFLNNLSHEIRTPINGIFNILEGLENEKIWNSTSDQEKRKLFRTFLDSRDRFMNLLSNLLDLSSLKSGKETMQMKHHDIKNIITDVAQEFQDLTDCIIDV